MKIKVITVAFILNIFFIYAEPVKVYFIDVGQGDSILIDYESIEILIDAGNNQYGDVVSNFLQDKVDGNIELMIATHPDADHIGGLDIVLENYRVDIVIDSGKENTTKTYQDFMQSIELEENVQFMYDDDMIFVIDENIRLHIIEIVDNAKHNNDNSVVCRLDIKDISFLFTGDLEGEYEVQCIEKFSHIDVLKVGHHGSRTSTTNLFLDTVNPSYAVISCGLDNRYGHPHSETLEKLKKANILTYRTDLQGTIIAVVEDNKITFNLEPVM